MIIPSSTFTAEGIDVGSQDRNMAYLYGLSDFFSYIFEDSEVTNLMLEANAVSASDIYSNFLQLTSSLTIADIQENVGASIKLVLIDSSWQTDVLPIFNIPMPISSAKFLADRAFLPNELLEEGIDFRITQTSTTTCTIQFAKPLSQYNFSTRPTLDGTTEYAIWATDVAIDAQLMYNYYGTLLGIKPEVSTDQFLNFIYGLYYVYLNGPTIQLLEQGLNLVLGIPLPRTTEVVLDIRTNTSTGQYIVITDKNQYFLPTGINPSVTIGTTIGVGASIARWVQIQDFTSNGKWWLNVSIPPEIIRSKPASQISRFASEGSRFDYLMTNYLAKNTFLVLIDVGAFRNNTYLNYLSDILLKAKPSQAQPVFVWLVDMSEEDFGNPEELSFTVTQVFSTMSNINCYPINSHYID
jgi:hypothetical protein